MLLNITVLVLILGITFLHSIFGFFSGLINAFCSIVAAIHIYYASIFPPTPSCLFAVSPLLFCQVVLGLSLVLCTRIISLLTSCMLLRYPGCMSHPLFLLPVPQLPD